MERKGEFYHLKPELALLLNFKKKKTRIDPTDRRVFESRGLVYQDLLYYDLAVEDFTSAISLAPEYPLNFFYRGKSFLWLGKYSEAVEDFDRAFALGCEGWFFFSVRSPQLLYLGFSS